VLLAGLFYLGSGLGLGLWILAGQPHRRPGSEAPIPRAELPWLAGAILLGGVTAPVLLMLGLSTTSASISSLLLNFEGVLTAALAWFALKENYDVRVVIGMISITAGGIALAFSGPTSLALSPGPLAIIGACLAWALDNNLTRKISGSDPAQIACIKGLVAGVVNTGIGLVITRHLLAWPQLVLAAMVGFLGYGVSLALFVLALRNIGAARTSAYFSLAPFIGAAVAIVALSEPVTGQFVLAGALMGIGLWLHLAERHEHEHVHEAVYHEHSHVHDEHHQHEHAPTDPRGEPHSHPHHHAPLRHTHPHYPDIHHRHGH
jgi:drug/metabolite transporter (DMT)-like permease